MKYSISSFAVVWFLVFCFSAGMAWAQEEEACEMADCGDGSCDDGCGECDACPADPAAGTVTRSDDVGVTGN